MDKDESRERRAHPRYDCSGEVYMRIKPAWPAVRGTIKNLSLGGCMIEFVHRQKIEDGQQVNLIFNVHNLPFHVQAAARGERGRSLYGFEFHQLRERTYEQLKELIAELDGGTFNPSRGDRGSVRLV